MALSLPPRGAHPGRQARFGRALIATRPPPLWSNLPDNPGGATTGDRIDSLQSRKERTMTNETLIDEPLSVGDVTPIPEELSASLRVVAGPDTGTSVDLKDPSADRRDKTAIFAWMTPSLRDTPWSTSPVASFAYATLRVPMAVS